MNSSRGYRIESIKNEKLLPFLMLDPIYNGHAIYVCKNKIDGTSLAAVCTETNEIHGTLVTGKPENYIVWGYWLTASSYAAAKALINEIKEETDVDINYPLWAEPIIKEYFPKAELTIDNLYIYPEADARALEDKNSAAQKLTKELFESVTVPKEFKNLLSSEDLLPESKFYCVVEDGVLCAIGERVVDSGQSAVISQLRTLEECRGKGYATSITRGLTHEILKEDKIPFYFFSEKNIPSKKTCERAGYVLHSRIGCK